MTAAGAAAGRWRSHAFGLALDGGFRPSGWPESEAPTGLPRVRIELAERERVDAALPARTRTLVSRPPENGEQSQRIFSHPRAGYLLDEGPFGLYHVSRGGTRIRCAVDHVAPWRWQRNLIGRVLPFACTLRGREPWHSAAVSWQGGAILLVGESGSGKTTLAVELMLHGAELVADDVVALERAASGVVAHPGPGLLSLRRPTVERLSTAQLASLGRRIGGDSYGVRVAAARFARELPLTAVCLLDPVRSGAPRVTPVPDPDPRRLLASTFNFVVRAPERLVIQLEICAAVAVSVPFLNAAIPPNADYRKLAAELLHALDGAVP